MDSAEFAEWMLEYHREPWGEWRADLRAGMIASEIANAHMTLRETILGLWAKGWRRNRTTFSVPADFMPDFTRKQAISSAQPERKIQGSAQLQAFFLNLTQQVGGTVQ